MRKRVIEKPDGLQADNVTDIYSVSDCMSKDFADYINYWKHNGYWLFDSPAVIENLARDNSIDLAGTRLFYYEVYELGFHEDTRDWHSFAPEPSFTTNVIVPKEKHLEGYDVATFSCGNAPECSPLSCNHLAAEIPTNQHCLLDSFDEAKRYLETGNFNNSEPGPFRVFAVYSFQRP
ncbi:MAG: hypothetical protein ACREQP_17910 [Candidatus Binatia bacterium]